MTAPRIVILDVADAICPASRCTQLDMVLRTVLPEPVIQRFTSLPPATLTAAPDLFFLRPSSGQPLSHLVPRLRQEHTQASLLAVCCAGGETPTTVGRSLHSGLDDFLCCPFTELDLLPRLHRLLPQRYVHPGAHERGTAPVTALQGIVGESPAFLRVVEQIPKLASADATVLLTGETGTGKEVIARALHYHSPRSGQPFIPVNCGALPDHLLENELFGHVKGAFTDASSAEKGLLAEAEGGTLFLDEVDALSAAAQVKLLRVLQDREYRPLGSAKSKQANVRIVAATNADLRRQVRAGQFREDLYYRLHLLSVRLPSLRERTADILLLAQHFLMQYSQRHGREALHFTAGAGQKLLAYPWPGNVRELESVIQRTVILLSSTVVEAEDLDLPDAPAQDALGAGPLRTAKQYLVEQFERTYLIDLLTTHRGNLTQAARQAGKDRRTLQRLLHKHGLERGAYQTRAVWWFLTCCYGGLFS